MLLCDNSFKSIVGYVSAIFGGGFPLLWLELKVKAPLEMSHFDKLFWTAFGLFDSLPLTYLLKRGKKEGGVKRWWGGSKPLFYHELSSFQ